MSDLEQVASRASHSITDGGDDPFQLECGVVFTFCMDGGVRIIHISEDIYTALANARSHKLASYESGIGVLSTGWASPAIKINGVTSPSEHPMRRRVRLVSCVDRARKMASSIRFADTEEELLDSGEVEGSLATAIFTALGEMLAE